MEKQQFFPSALNRISDQAGDRWRITRLGAALSVSCLVLLSACGGGSADDFAQNSATTAPATPAETPVAAAPAPAPESGSGSTETTPPAETLPIVAAPPPAAGGSGGAPAVIGAGFQPGTHLAALGPLSGASVTVSPWLQRNNVLIFSTTSSNGAFNLNTSNLPAEFDSQLLVVSVSGGDDIDANDDGILDAVPTPNTGTLYALVRGSDLKSRSVAVTLLSEAIFRSVQGQGDTVLQEAIERSMEEIAYQLFDNDLDNDGFISYGDVLSFNPTRQRDKSLLSFAYNDFLITQPDGKSVVKKFHDNDLENIPRGIDIVLGGKALSRLPDQDETGMVIVSISSGNGGTVTSQDILITTPNGLAPMELGSGNMSYTHTMERKTATKVGGKVTFKATPDDGFIFNRWVGCESPAVVMGDVCVVQNAADNFAVSAQFTLTENKLAQGISNQVLVGDAPGKLGVVLSKDNTATLTVLLNKQPIRRRWMPSKWVRLCIRA